MFRDWWFPRITESEGLNNLFICCVRLSLLACVFSHHQNTAVVYCGNKLFIVIVIIIIFSSMNVYLSKNVTRTDELESRDSPLVCYANSIA